MLTSVSTVVILMITSFLVTILLVYLLNEKTGKNQTHNIFIFMCLLMLFWLLELICQAVFSIKWGIDPIYFDYLVYINACLLPVMFFLLSISFSNTKFKFSKNYLLLFVVPLMSLLVLWTNDFHHLFYEKYSINFNECITGPYLTIHSIYSYTLIAIALIRLLGFSIKNSGFFSRQSTLLSLGILLPVIINALGTFGAIKMSIYITPISFTLAILFFAFAILKFDFLKIAPIALQRIVDSMSDSYLILNDEFIITDFNQTFLKTFSIGSDEVRNKNLFNLIKNVSEFNINLEKLTNIISASKLSNSTITLEKYFENINKYFRIEINSITNKGNFLGTLILIKDTTQHNIDMQTIKNNQEILVEKERLSSLGQMIGGIAHNLKTPIMSIAGAMEGLSDLVKEYDMSIEDKEVTKQDHHEIAHDMQEWIDKTRTHLSYMSDVITAVKGQAVAFSDNMYNGFTVGELIKHVDILMKHELKNALINLKTTVSIDENTQISGNINSLVQVINNIISNAIQAYNGKTNEDILFNLEQENNHLIITIQDFAGGLPKNVQEKLFKEMITTKGKNGTGLGLFMSYSNIKAHFNGNMHYKTEENKGTTFYIKIPIHG